MNRKAIRSLLSGPWPWVLAAAGVVAVAVFRPSAPKEPELVDPRPIGTAADIEALSERDDVNVLFVLIDTLRAERMQVFGYERPTTPFLDALASQGIRFDRNLAQSSWTKCSMASLWTGRYPQRAGVTRFDHVLSPEATLPAEIFRDAGFRTAGIWRNGWVEGYFGFDQGFDVYLRPTQRPPPPDLVRQNPTISSFSTDLDVVDAAMEFLRINGRDRWFLYLHLMDVHEFVYDEDTARFGTTNADIYDNAVLRMDRVQEILVTRLFDMGFLDNTIIVIGSDHGEAFGERGIEGHARAVDPETTEVPLILSLPYRLQPGIVLRQRTANVDIFPTVLDLLGLPALEGADGRSRVPEILASMRGEDPPEDDTAAIAHLDQTWGQRVTTTSHNVAVAEKDFRYLSFRNPSGELREELFSLADREERKNLAKDEPEVTARLRGVAESYLASDPGWSETGTLELDEMQLNQLRALGYAIP
jgi:arylsulfatase A-like enzyme